MVHLSLLATSAASSLAAEVRRLCFRIVSWVPQNGFVGISGLFRVQSYDPAGSQVARWPSSSNRPLKPLGRRVWSQPASANLGPMPAWRVGSSAGGVRKSRWRRGHVFRSFPGSCVFDPGQILRSLGEQSAFKLASIGQQLTLDASGIPELSRRIWGRTEPQK
jgi:hypothetical protein